MHPVSAYPISLLPFDYYFRQGGQPFFAEGGRAEICVEIDLRQHHPIIFIGSVGIGMITIPTEEEILSIMDEIRRNPNSFRFIA